MQEGPTEAMKMLVSLLRAQLRRYFNLFYSFVPSLMWTLSVGVITEGY